MTEMFYACDAAGVAIDDPAVTAAEPLLLEDMAHKTDGGWYITFDGENIRGVRPGS